MSRRDGHEWVRIKDSLLDLPLEMDSQGCQGKNGTCLNPSQWEKVLYACDKSSYCGGYFCEACAIEEGMFVPDVSEPNPIVPKMHHTLHMRGECITCKSQGQEFVSFNETDQGPWICPKCASIIETYLNATGYVLAILVPTS